MAGVDSTGELRPLGCACRAAVLAAALAALGACGGGGGGGGPPGATAPVITAQPSPATVADGATASFAVTATGTAPLAYQWRRNGADLSDGGGVAGATTAALSLVAPYAYDGSQISVRVSNAAGNVTSGNALLTVTPLPPTITGQPASVTVAVGTPAVFSVVVSGGTAPVTYQWKRGAAAIAGATLPMYAVAAAALADSGAMFTVDVSNPAGTLTSTVAVLTVTASPAVRAWGAPFRINGGDANSDPGYPQVGIDTAGNAIAVWQEETAGAARNAVWSNRYTAGGAWGTAATIDNPTGNAIRPQLAVAPGGDALAAFPQSTMNNSGIVDVWAARYAAAGGGWTAPLKLDLGDLTNAEFPVVGLAPDGAGTVAFTQSDGTSGRAWANRSSTAGVWGTAAVVDAAGPSVLPALAVASNGHAIMAWVQQTGALTNSLWSSRNTSTGWSTPALLTPDTGSVRSGIRLAADASGNTMAAWTQMLASGRFAIRAARLDAATGLWSAPATVNVPNAARDAFAPDLAADTGGNAVAVWYESAGAALLGVSFSRYSAAGGTWSAAAPVQPAADPRGEAPRVAVDANGGAIAVWRQPFAGTPGSHVWAARSAPGAAAWDAPIDLLTDQAAYAQAGSDQEPVIAVNAGGDAVVLWYQRTDAPAASAGIWARIYR